MKPHDLLKACISIIDTFDPKRTTVDAHSESSAVMKKTTEVEAKFIKQVFYGCVRYQKFLRIFVTGFLYKNPATAQRSDQTLYTVLAYLLIFRLKELGIAEFRNFVLCASYPAMLAFLQFASSKKDLEEWVKMEWCKVYDIEYIERDIIGTIQELLPPDNDLVNEISIKATGMRISKEDTAATTEKKKQVTVPEPFDLTVPRPRLVPLPEPIEREVKAKEVNPIIFKNSLAKIEEEDVKRKEQVKAATENKYSEEERFRLRTEGRASDIDKIRQQVENEKFAECTFQPDLPKPYVPSVQKAEVSMNTAAILREDALLRNKQEKEFAILKEYESDLRDCSQFYEWQYEMRKKDQLEEQARVEQRKMEMKMARVDAMEAFDSMKRMNKLQAAQQKESAKMALDVVEGEKMLDLQEKQQLVEDVRDQRILPRYAEEDVLKVRIKHAEDLRKQREVDLERVAKEQAYEMAKKKDLIRQIRALERVSVVRPVPFDPSEPPRHGVLEEMSYAELQERLTMERARREREVEVRRQNIIEDRNQKVEDLATRAEQCAKIRDMAREESEARREKLLQRKAKVEVEKQKVREASVLAAQEKIAAKKRERRNEELRLRRELKQINTKRQFLQANAEMVEKKAYEEQQTGLQREARTKQEDAIRVEKRHEEIARTEAKLRRLNRKNEYVEHKEVQEAFDKHMEIARVDDEMFTAEVRSANKTARELQRRTEAKLLYTQRRDKPYATKINDALMETVRTQRAREAELTRSARALTQTAQAVVA